MQFKRQRELKRTKIEIIPMIDTMFFLLVFFMLSSLALTRLNGLPVNLPRASTAPKAAAVDLTITVDKEFSTPGDPRQLGIVLSEIGLR